MARAYVLLLAIPIPTTSFAGTEIKAAGNPLSKPSTTVLGILCVLGITSVLSPLTMLHPVGVTTQGTMPQAPNNPIPSIYRFFFTFVDPIICVWGAYLDFFNPTLVLSSHIPNLAHDVGHRMILAQRGGGMLNFGFISAVLLRYTEDPVVWRIVQVADLIVDFAYFWAVYGALSVQDRLAPATWRPEDKGSLVITGAATLMRLCFLMGLGLRKSEKKVEKKA